MTKMNQEDINKLLQQHKHLKDYVESVKNKLGEPVFYTKLPFEVRDEKNQNLIYSTQGIVFVHVYKTPDMDEIEYHAIEPELNEVEKEKHDQLLKLIVKRAPEKQSVIEDEELKGVLKELIDEIIQIDERAIDIEKPKKEGKVTQRSNK